MHPRPFGVSTQWQLLLSLALSHRSFFVACSQMENISNFIRGCRAIGVPEYSLFETVDLYEGKDVGLVVKCLVSDT